MTLRTWSLCLLGFLVVASSTENLLGRAAARGAIHEADAAPVQPTTKIVGVVVDEGGKPVAGARVNTVWLRKLDKDVLAAPDGSFTLQLGLPMRLAEDVLATTDNGARQGIARFDETSLAPLPVKVVLKPARTVTVHVIDARGIPVTGATVEAASLGIGSLTTALTDVHGIARLQFSSDASLVRLTALKAGAGFDIYENERPWPPMGRSTSVPDEVTLTLDGARTIAIQAIDSAGRPIKGVAFVPATLHKNGKLVSCNLGANSSAVATTGADGVARFDWIPRRVDEPILFVCNSFEFHDAGLLMTYPGESDAALSTRLQRMTPLEGKIRDSNGSGVGGVLVVANGMARGNLGRGLTRTRKDGSFKMEVPPNQVYTIVCLDSRGAAAPLTGVVVREGAPQTGLEMHMNMGALVHGKVTQKSDQRPAARQQVWIELPAEEIPEEFRLEPQATRRHPVQISTVTDDHGIYSFRLTSGEYRLSSGRRSGQSWVRIGENEEIVRDFEIAEESLKPLAAPTLAGTVVERTIRKRPVPGAEIQEVVTEQTGFPPAKAIADAQGRFLFSGGVRPRLVYARSPDGSLAGFTEVAPTGEVEIPVAAAATVVGKVVDRDGNPARSRALQLMMTGGAGSFQDSNLFWRFYTDEAGTFLFSGFVPGSEGHLSIAPTGLRRAQESSDKREFKVTGPEPIVLSNLIVPAEAVRTVVGRLCLPTDNLVPVDWGRSSCTIEPTSVAIRPPEGLSVQERVKWYREWSQTEAGIAYSIHRHTYNFKPGADGAFRMDLPAGSYSLSVRVTEPGGPNQPGLEGRTLATLQRVFLVPDILPDRKVDSLDLGNLEVNVVQRLRVGDLAPAFAVPSLDGKTTLKLEDYRGKYVLLHFWSTWCRGCPLQTPFLKRVDAKFAIDKRFVLLGVSWDYTIADAEKYLSKNQIGWAQGILQDTQSPGSGGGKIVKEYSVGLPQIWLIGPDGKILARDLRDDGIEQAVAKALRKEK